MLAGKPAGPKPLSGAKKPPIAFIGELEKQIRVGLVLRGEGQSAISDRAGVAHGIWTPNDRRTALKPVSPTPRVFLMTLVGVASR
jgi:hypothetical protein